MAGGIGAGGNLDEYMPSGHFNVYQAGWSGSRKNAPSGWYGGMLICGSYGGFGFQLAFEYNSTRAWIRCYYSGNFRTWVEIS